MLSIIYVVPIVDTPFFSKDSLVILSNIDTTEIPSSCTFFNSFIVSVASVKTIIHFALASFEKEVFAVTIASSTDFPSSTVNAFIVSSTVCLLVLLFNLIPLLSATEILIPETLSNSVSARFAALPLTFCSGSFIPVLLEVSINRVTSFVELTCNLFFSFTSYIKLDELSCIIFFVISVCSLPFKLLLPSSITSTK